MSDSDLRQDLFLQDPGATLYVTLGNPLRSDDGVGPYIAGIAAGIPGIRIRDAGERPERALDWAMELRPATLVFIDAADFGGAPGEIRDLPVESLGKTTFSTHRLPLPAIMDWISHETGTQCRCIGIQLGSTAFGEGLTPPVKQSADRLAKWVATKVCNP